MIRVNNLPHPVHMEWLVALHSSPIDFRSNSSTYHHWRKPLADCRWRELKPIDPKYRKTLFVKCPHCNRELGDDELVSRAKWSHRRQFGTKFWLEHVRIPPALREAVGQRSPVAYWVGRCDGCDTVLWAPDDGKPAEVES